MKEINLYKILTQHVYDYLRPSFPSDERTKEVVELWYTLTEEKQAILDAMKEACDQTVDLCAENADLEYRVYSASRILHHSENLGKEITTEREQEYVGVKKESILKTKNQIK